MVLCNSPFANKRWMTPFLEKKQKKVENSWTLPTPVSDCAHGWSQACASTHVQAWPTHLGNIQSSCAALVSHLSSQDGWNTQPLGRLSHSWGCPLEQVGRRCRGTSWWCSSSPWSSRLSNLWIFEHEYRQNQVTFGESPIKAIFHYPLWPEPVRVGQDRVAFWVWRISSNFPINQDVAFVRGFRELERCFFC